MAVTKKSLLGSKTTKSPKTVSSAPAKAPSSTKLVTAMRPAKASLIGKRVAF